MEHSTEIDKKQLSLAFDIFNQHSEELVDTYADLSAQVEKISSELQAQAEHSQDWLQSLLTILPAGVIVLDNQGCIVHANPAAIDLLGEPLIGEQWLSVIARAFAPKQDDGHEVSLLDGRRVSVAINSLASGSGEIILLNDLTETRALQERLSRHQHLSAMGEMTASLAHQIRTPLASALLYSSHLIKSDLPELKREQFAKEIIARLNHLEQIVKDMLLFAKEGEVAMEVVEVDKLVKHINDMFAEKFSEEAVTFNINNHLHGQKVRANFCALSGAIENIINNALELEQNNLNLTLSVFTDTDTHAESSLNILIQDNGAGLPAAQLQKVAQPFYTTKSTGTGLGLAVVQGVAKAHGGDIVLVSEEGRGSIIGLRFPYQEAGVNA